MERNIRTSEAQKLKGFTTIELLVNISIVLLLSGLVITYNRVGEKQIIFIKERSRFVDTLYKAKGLSIQTFSEDITPCGFGVEILDDKNYVLYKDLAGDDGKCASSDLQFSRLTNFSNSPEFMEGFALDKSITFDLSGIPNPRSVLFVPPDPDVIIGGKDKRSSLNIKIEDESSNNNSQIFVTQFGQISIDFNAAR